MSTEKVEKIINDHPVVVFSKSWCAYSRRSKQTLDSLGADYVAFELDQMPDGDELQRALEDLTGQQTVPNSFVAKKHIGGNSELQALLRGGKLEDMLRNAGALKKE